ncbi:hypothetical protein CATRI_00035 [Corynebacterium atrinae]|uniref:TetR family transcriptional regulator n=1 Tax=Corynebacterium atrinae TaxID=1336740 RepID=UPI0025B37457|nr:TetR family transcriptional regulator [Corynebacterium atrinae]WJY62132.1 hypothetical protein CATRI_00035 [Corynebacterium atrinae]
MRPLSPEQLLLVADEFCEFHRCQVRSFSALVAAAVVPGARLDGVWVHASVPTAAAALEETVVQLQPLDRHNTEFGALCREVYLHWAT